MPPDDNEEEDVLVDEEEAKERSDETTQQRRPLSFSDRVAEELLAQGRELRQHAASSSDGPGVLMILGSEFVTQTRHDKLSCLEERPTMREFWIED